MRNRGEIVFASYCLGHDDLIFRFTDSAARNLKKKKIKFKAIDRVTGSLGVLKLYSSLCHYKRLYSLGVRKCEWEETFGGLFDRTMAMSLVIDCREN